MSYGILIAVVIQAVITRVSRMAGAVVGYLITTGILLWGLATYSQGGYITLYGARLPRPVFVIVCLVWYAFDTWGFVQARKHQARQKQLSGTSPSSEDAVGSPPATQIGEGAEGNVAIVVSWQGKAAMDAGFEVQVSLDGAPVGSGSFVEGFVQNLTTTEGAHEIGVKMAFRRSSVTLHTESNKSYRVDLEHSTFSGKFRLKTSETDGQVG